MPWDTSSRRTRLPGNWSSTIVPRVWARDRGMCQWPTADGPCHAPGRDVDHRLDPDDHTYANLWLLCGDHHDAKTRRESVAGRSKTRQRRQPEPHPGVR